MIKTEKELVRLIWKEMGLGGHNADIRRRTMIAKEVHKAVELGLKEWPPEKRDDLLDAIAGWFLSRIGGIKEEEFTKAFYTNLLSSITPRKKT